MNTEQFLLLKLAEECAEVSQRASKQIQFGKDESQPNQLATNGERLKGELLDLMAVVSLLIDSGEVPYISVGELIDAKAEKKAKMQHYLDLSFKLGKLPEIKL